MQDGNLTQAGSLAHKPTAPWLFALLDLPFAAGVGYLQIAVPFWLSQRGVPLQDIATLAATGYIPHAYKIAWIPLLDIFGSRKQWFAAMGASICALLFAASLIPDPKSSLPLLTILMLLAQACSATLSSALDSLMATTTAEHDKARAGGWKMAGNVGGTAVLGTMPLWLSKLVSQEISGMMLAAIVAATTALIVFVHEPQKPKSHESRWLQTKQTLGALWVDASQLVRSRQGWTGLLICAAPVGCGALSNLFSGMAQSFSASDTRVELVNGLFGGLCSAAGSIVGGYLADRMNRRVAYLLSGVLIALVALAMAFSPTNEATYTYGVLAYSFMTGVSFAAFAGMVLELVGSGAGVTTKYALFVATSNQAISYVTWLDGRQDALGPFGLYGVRSTLMMDAVTTFVGVVTLSLLFLWLRRSDPNEPAQQQVNHA